MIILKIIIQYFIQITHTDYFPSMSTRLVMIMLNSISYRHMTAYVGLQCSRRLHVQNIHPTNKGTVATCSTYQLGIRVFAKYEMPGFVYVGLTKRVHQKL